jgi:hypothetical protein
MSKSRWIVSGGFRFWAGGTAKIGAGTLMRSKEKPPKRRLSENAVG